MRPVILAPHGAAETLITESTSGPTSATSRMLTAREAANLAGVRRETVGQWRRAGLLRAATLDGAYLYDIADVRLVIGAIRRTSGVDRAWVREQLVVRDRDADHR